MKKCDTSNDCTKINTTFDSEDFELPGYDQHEYHLSDVNNHPIIVITHDKKYEEQKACWELNQKIKELGW